METALHYWPAEKAGWEHPGPTCKRSQLLGDPRLCYSMLLGAEIMSVKNDFQQQFRPK